MAIKYLAGNRLVSNDASDSKPTLTAAVAGTTYLDFAQDLWRWDGDSWELVVGNLLTENFQNKTFVDYCLVSEVSTPSGTVGAGKAAIYAKSDGKLYSKFENETERDLSTGSGAANLNDLGDVTIGGVTLAAGHVLVYDGSSAFLNKPLSGATGTTASLSAAGALDITALTVLTDLDLTSGNKTIFDTVGANTITFAHSSTQTTFPGNVTVSGNFTVSGTTTTVSTTNTIIADHLLELNTGASSNADDSGIIIERGSTGNNAIIAWDESEDGFIVGTTTATADATGNLTIAAAPFQASAITGTTGTFTGALTTNNKLLIDTANSALSLSADGQLLHIDALTFTDGTTSASGTAAQNYASVNLDQATLAATNSSVTTTRAATLNITGAPIAGTNMTLTNSYALYVAGGASHFVGAVTSAAAITGATLVSTAGTTANSLTVTTNATVGGTLGVTGATTTASTTGHVTVGGNLSVTGTSGFTGTVTLPSGTALTAPAITGGTAIELTQLSVRDNSAAYDLEFQSATTSMGADRLLIFDVNNADRTVSLAGNVTFAGAVTTAGAFITSGANSLTLTTTGTTNVTLPTTGTVATLAGTETLAAKTLTQPKFVDGGFIADANGAEMLVFNTKAGSGVENHFSMTNGRDSATDTGPVFAAVGDDTNVALRLQGKGTGASAVIEGGATGACIEFTTKYTGGAAASAESARLYMKEVDTNNNALACRIQKAGSVVEVEITSPKAICGECGSQDGAKDPTYDFSRSMMIVDLWCGHSYEVPMTGWNMVN